jgi:hypothetical protein
MHEDLEFSRVGIDESAKPAALVSLADPLMDASQSAKPTHLWSTRPICPRSFQIGPAELPVMLGPIYVIGGLPCWHIYVI